MQINKNELLKAIKYLDLIVDKKSSGIGNSIYFDTKNIIASNNGMLLSYPFITDFKCFISPEKIIKYLEKVKQEEIDIIYENDILTLKDKKTELILKTFVNIKDILELKEVIDWKELPDDFFKGLRYSMYSSTNEIYIGRDFIGYILFKDNKIFSTNNRKLSEYTFDNVIGDFSIYNNIILILLKIPDIINYCLLEDKIIFKTKDNLIIYCETKNIDFPKYEDILALRKENIEIDFLDCLIESLDFCEILNQDLEYDDKKINFEINKNKLLVYTETIEGKIKYEYDLKKEYEQNINFYLNPNLIKEIIQQKDFKCYYDLQEKIYFMNDKYRFVCMIKKGE